MIEDIKQLPTEAKQNHKTKHVEKVRARAESQNVLIEIIERRDGSSEKSALRESVQKQSY